MTKSDNPKGEAAVPASPTTAQSVQADELLTIAEVAAYLKLSRRTAWRWCRSGQLHASKVGQQWRVTRRDLENLVHRRGKIVA